jgi:hypothetical protein
MTEPIPPDDEATPPEPVTDETLTPLEETFYALVLAALTSWLAAVAAKVLNPFRLFKRPPDPGGLWSTVPAWNDEVKKLVAWLGDNAAPHGWDRWDDEHPGLVDLPVYPSTNAFVVAHLAQVANYLVRIPDEVYNQIIAEIVDGHNEGENLEDIAARIENVLNVTGSENWPNRARVISVTEVNGAANAGWLAAGFQTEKILGHSLDKEWLAAHDSHVRPEHREADGQRRPLAEPFVVAGFPMMMPGDKSAPPHLVINCRCTATTTEARA